MDRPARTPTPGAWHRSGEAWIVGLYGRRTPLRDSKGLRHLAHLLRRPGDEVSSLDLVALGEERVPPAAGAGAAAEGLHAGPGDAGAVLDEQAKREYRTRLADLQAEVDEAERFHDPERAAAAKAELDFLARELSAAVGLGGRDRRVGAATERARVNVTRSIKSAVDRIAEHDEALAAHLRAGVRTGAFCVYEPPAVDPVAWDFSEAPAEPPAAVPQAAGAPAAIALPRPAVRAAEPLLEREVPLAAVAAELDAAAAGAGRVVLVEGPPGIGKSALLVRAVELAAERGFGVLQGRARELESPLAFGIARQLFEAPLAEMDEATRVRVLRGAVSPAAAMLGHAAVAPGAEAAGPFPVLRGLHWLVAALAQAQPLLLIVDDLQWADAESRQWLAYMSSRLEDLAVTVLVATRPVPPGAGDDAHAELLEGRRTSVVPLAPLSERAVGDVVRRTAPDAEDAFVVACAQASGGNPFFLQELLAAARAAGLAPDAAGARELRSITPESVSRLVLARLRPLGADATALARAYALLGPVDGGLAAEVAGVAPPGALAAADALATAGILVARRPLDFAHPLIRAAVEEAIPLAARTELHERAARLLAARGAAAIEVAGHLLHAHPAGEPATVTVLRHAAAYAAVHGSPHTAVELLDRALAEPPAPDEVPAVLLELARAQAAAGSPAHAVATVRRALPLADDPIVHARLVDELCRHDRDDPGAHVAMLEQEVARVAGLDRELRFRLEARALDLLHYDAVVEATEEARVRHDERLERVAAGADGTTTSERMLLAMSASQLAIAWRVPAEEVRRRAELSLRDGQLVQRLAEGDLACDAAIEALVLADALEAADHHARDAERRARERGAVVAEGYAGALRAVISLRRGDLLEAGALAPGALAMSEESGEVYGGYVANGVQALIAIDRGDAGAATEAIEAVAAVGFSPIATPALRGLLLSAQGEHDLAAEQLEAALALQRAAGRRCSMAFGSMGPELALSLAATDRREEAAALAQEEVAAARAYGAATPLGVALRALGLVGSGPHRLATLEEAVAVLARGPARLQHARALHALGGARLLAGDAAGARAPLAAAVEAAERCGAGLVAAAARAELEAAGGAPAPSAPSPQALLTPGERRVARLAAEGFSELEIAQALLTTVPSVTDRLASAQAKLGVRERADLALALAVS